MSLIFYPIFLVAAVIVFYYLGRHSSPIPEVSTPTDVTQELPVNIYVDEPEESYLLRCQNFIVAFLTEIDAQYLVAPDYSYYQLEVFAGEEYNNFIRIDPYFARGSKYISFETRINAVAIPDDKLPLVAELINRVNNELLFIGLSLDYQNRSINYKNTYKVGHQAFQKEYFWFHLSAVNAAVNFMPFVERVTLHHEEPVLVALDYLSAQLSKIQ